MCGIAGIVALGDEVPAADTVPPMLRAINHRGPDDSGTIAGARAALGMVRLSIIDIEGGRQPIGNEDGTIWAVLNGEIYNYRELRADLSKRGHAFRTQSDTECLVHAYEEYRDDFVRHLRGMFALALWDQRGDRVLLARDRIGEKPLFWTQGGSFLYFASELKALPQALRSPSSIDPLAINEYLSFGYISAPRTAFRRIEKVLPAHLMTIGRGRVNQRSYWQLPIGVPPRFRTLEEAKEVVQPLLLDAVRTQMISDAPLGALMSGGIDSTAVVALMRKVSSHPIRTFCVGFEDKSVDERAAAKEVADHLETEHSDVVATPSSPDDVINLIRHFDEPFGDKSLVPTASAFALAKRHVKVVLTGDGGDEVFGGYKSYSIALRRERERSEMGRQIRRIVAGSRRVMPSLFPGWSRLSRWSSSPSERFVFASTVFSPRERSLLTGGGPRRPVVSELSLRVRALKQKPLDSLQAMQVADFLYYLPDDVLTKVDRMSMYTSLESRAPLLDHRIAEVMVGLPAALKIHGDTTKILLRSIVSPLLPPSVMQRPKQGFTVPTRSWLNGPLRQASEELIMALPAKLPLFDRKAVAAIVHRERRRQGPMSNKLWLLFSLGAWLA